MTKYIVAIALATSTCLGVNEFFPTLKFYQTKDTLYRIAAIISQKKKGMYLRFGDGDVNLANGDVDLLQSPREDLRREMREAFQLNGPYILKALPIMCREFGAFEEGMFNLNHEVSYRTSLRFLFKTEALWGGDITDVYSPVALHFASTNYQELAFSFLRVLRGLKSFMLVGNHKIPKVIRDVLFGDQCLFVPTPDQQAYDAIDEVEQACIKHIEAADPNEYKIIITSMGCAGRVLQKRLWKRFDNIFLFDFGSLMDALSGMNTRAWIQLNSFDNKEFLKKFVEYLIQNNKQN